MQRSVAGDLLDLVRRGDDWESVLFEAACAGARGWAEQLLEAVDAALYTERDGGLVVEGYRSRTVLTRMGPVCVRRRLYQDGGRGRFLLDEAMGWTRCQAASPALKHMAVKLASHVSFRQAAELLGVVISQSVGRMSIHRLLQTVGAQQKAAEAAQRAGVYEQGQPPPTGTEVADPLFIEGDGVSLALQREERKRGELKAAIASSGRSLIGVDKKGRHRRKVTGKVTYAGIESGEPFWEGAWLTIASHYDLEQTTQFVVGGDGASWIRGALEGVSGGVFQLDRFHLARELKRVLGPSGMAAFQAARAGDDAELKRLLGKAWQAAGDDQRRHDDLLHLEHYLSSNHDGLMDWYLRVDAPPAELVGLGAMEANVDKPFANRMKKRGMSWTLRGAHHMAKILQLEANGQLAAACSAGRRPLTPGARLRPASAATTAPRAGLPSAPPFQATFAPRWGPHASHPWVLALCRLIEEPRIRN